jgi:outer membrane receptor protein involved in Fe transport
MKIFFYKTGTLMLILFSNIVYQSSAQGISGRVKEAGGMAIENATITLLNAADSTIIKYEVSNKDGYFELANLKSGVFVIKVSLIGYQAQLLSNIKVNGSTIKVADVILNKQEKQLKEVTIVNKAPILERKVDRLIFNLNNTITASGSSLFEALQMAPLLTISESGVSMAGKGGLAVMINEKIVYLSGPELANYLKTLRAENVEKIEIITTPPAKYEAQGNGGLINIVLKKNESLGWRGSVSSTYYQNARSSYSNNLGLFYRSKKVSSSITFNQSNFHSINNESVNIIGRPNEILSDEQRLGKSSNFQTGLSIDYELNKHDNIGLIYNVSDNKSNTNFDNNYRFVTGGIVDSVLKTTGQFSRPLFTQTFNIYHDLKLDSTGKKLSSSINFFTNRPEMKNNFVSESENTSAAVQNNSLSKYNIWTVQSDLTLPYKWAKIETGAKFATYNNSASVAYYNNIHDNFLIDNTRSNNFNYSEGNVAIYYSMESELSKKWSAKAGLRYEYTMMNGYSPTLNQRNKRYYGALFPTAYLTYKADADNTFSVNYSRRINRPSLNSLNPFVYYTNIYTSYAGNPLLLPSYSNNVELNYLYKGMLSFTVFTQHTSDVISSVTKVDGPFITSGRGNFLTQDNLGAYASFNKVLFKWWESSNSASIFYASAKSKIGDIHNQRGLSASFNINNNFKASNLLSFYLNYGQNLPSTSGNVYTYAQRNFRTGARSKLLNNNLIISPSYFRGSVPKYEYRYSGFVQTDRMDYNYNLFNLNITYLFGRSKVSGNNKDIRFDEKGRAQQ